MVGIIIFELRDWESTTTDVPNKKITNGEGRYLTVVVRFNKKQILNLLDCYILKSVENEVISGRVCIFRDVALASWYETTKRTWDVKITLQLHTLWKNPFRPTPPDHMYTVKIQLS